MRLDCSAGNRKLRGKSRDLTRLPHRCTCLISVNATWPPNRRRFKQLPGDWQPTPCWQSNLFFWVTKTYAPICHNDYSFHSLYYSLCIVLSVILVTSVSTLKLRLVLGENVNLSHVWWKQRCLSGTRERYDVYIYLWHSIKASDVTDVSN